MPLIPGTLGSDPDHSKTNSNTEVANSNIDLNNQSANIQCDIINHRQVKHANPLAYHLNRIYFAVSHRIKHYKFLYFPRPISFNTTSEKWSRFCLNY